MKVLDTFRPKPGVLALLLKCRCVVERRGHRGRPPAEQPCKKHDTEKAGGRRRAGLCTRRGAKSRARGRVEAPPADRKPFSAAGTAVGSAPGSNVAAPPATPIAATSGGERPSSSAGAYKGPPRKVVKNLQREDGRYVGVVLEGCEHTVTFQRTQSKPATVSHCPECRGRGIGKRLLPVDKKVTTGATASSRPPKVKQTCRALVGSPGAEEACGEPAATRDLCQRHYGQDRYHARGGTERAHRTGNKSTTKSTDAPEPVVAVVHKGDLSRIAAPSTLLKEHEARKAGAPPPGTTAAAGKEAGVGFARLRELELKFEDLEAVRLAVRRLASTHRSQILDPGNFNRVLEDLLRHAQRIGWLDPDVEAERTYAQGPEGERRRARAGSREPGAGSRGPGAGGRGPGAGESGGAP